MKRRFTTVLPNALSQFLNGIAAPMSHVRRNASAGHLTVVLRYGDRELTNKSDFTGWCITDLVLSVMLAN
ncbi:MAG: hypothetical protein WBA55_07180 [Allopontixanthobacter sediminis]